MAVAVRICNQWHRIPFGCMAPSLHGSGRITRLYPLLGPIPQGLLDRQTEDGRRPLQPGSAEHRLLVPRQSAHFDQRAATETERKTTRSLRILRCHWQLGPYPGFSGKLSVTGGSRFSAAIEIARSTGIDFAGRFSVIRWLASAPFIPFAERSARQDPRPAPTAAMKLIRRKSPSTAWWQSRSDGPVECRHK